MAFDNVTHVFGVKDCKIAKMTADSGSSPTYDTSVDVPGIQEVTVRFNIEEKELQGDDVTLDIRSKLKSLEVSAVHAKISLDVLPVLLGGATTESGTTPNIKKTYARAGADVLTYFKIEAQVVEVDDEDADLHFVCYKCKVTNHEMGAKGEDYRTVSFSAKGIPCASNDSFYDLVANETAAAIA
ncbi:MAG: hypothetical protein AB1384_12415 [Actinomycetota bacterium]